jgi:hypothetical protein
MLGAPKKNPHKPLVYEDSIKEATTRFELVMRVLQTRALPLGYVARYLILMTPRGFEPLLPP